MMGGQNNILGVRGGTLCARHNRGEFCISLIYILN